MLELLPGWEYRKRSDGSWQQDGGSMIGGAEWSLVLHTMESWDFEGSMNYLTTKGLWPQLCYDQRDRRKVQGIPLDRAGKALANKAGGVQTNRENTIQVELPGYAAFSHDWDKDWLDNLAEDVVVPLREAGVPIKLVAPKFVGQESGFIARADAPQRMSYADWQVFGGICGHQHVPENDHWDPGRLDIARVLATAGGTTTRPQEDGMHIVSVSDGPNVGQNYVIDTFIDNDGRRDVGIVHVAPDKGTTATFGVAPSLLSAAQSGVRYEIKPSSATSGLRSAPNPSTFGVGGAGSPVIDYAAIAKAVNDAAAARLKD